MISLDVLDRTKLVIWDLDGTFWTGVLSEHDATFRSDRRDMVDALIRHGVMNSLASCNTFEHARAFLTDHAAWHLFVFPKIDWRPKASMVRDILTESGLRPEHTLFVDDEPRHRAAVVAAIPGLLGATAIDEFQPTFIDWHRQRLPRDPARRRLAQYKVLERKHTAARAVRLGERRESAEDFLRSSRIRCRIVPVDPNDVDRVHELIQRANQLNYTKRRLDETQLAAALRDSSLRCRAVYVCDRFGDYGLCGFLALRADTRTLVDFLFSCRLAGMWIESAVLRHLEFPEVAAADDRRASLVQVEAIGRTIDWVDVVEDQQSTADGRSDPALPVHGEPPFNVTLVGPCELSAVAYCFMTWFGDRVNTDLRSNFTTADGRHITHFGFHSLARLGRAQSALRHADVLTRLPWFDQRLIEMSYLDKPSPSVVLMSAVRNVQCAEYEHASGEFRIPFDFYRVGGIDLTNPEHFGAAERFIRYYHGGCPPDFLPWFSQNFRFVGPVSEAGYRDSLEELVQSTAEHITFALINVADVDRVNLEPCSWCPAPVLDMWRRQHAAVNAALADCARRHPSRVVVIDVNRAFRRRGDFAPPPSGSPAGVAFEAFNIYYHYSRRVLISIAMEARRAIERAPGARAEREPAATSGG